MSNLKKDIEEILKDFVLWRTKIIDGKPVATYDKNMLSEWEREQYQPMEAVTQIINLIEKSEQKLLAKMTLDCKTVDYQGEQWNAILVKKLKNITFEQDEDIPNGAWGKNSLKKDIREEILDILRWPYNKRPVRLTQSEALRQQRATDILNLIESVIPEEQTVYGGEIRDHESTGYNRAIKDIKSKLIDGSKNNGK